MNPPCFFFFIKIDPFRKILIVRKIAVWFICRCPTSQHLWGRRRTRQSRHLDPRQVKYSEARSSSKDDFFKGWQEVRAIVDENPFIPGRGRFGCATPGSVSGAGGKTGGLVSSVSHTLGCNSPQRVSSAACRSGAGVAKIGKDTSQRRRIINHMRKGETKSNTRQLLHLLTRSGWSLP